MRITALLLTTALVSGCHTMTQEEQHDVAVGMTVFSITAASVATGMVGGLAFLPFLIAADVHHTNYSMEQANVGATLGDTYQYAYDRRIETVPANGNTGGLFRDMKGATAHFQKVLRGHGVANPENFVLTAVRTADTDGYTLYALVNRPNATIRVRDQRGRVRTLTAADRDYYRTYRQDANGRALDVVVDWAGVARSSISTQKGQAILLTLAANSVLINRRSDDYWSIERRWLSGDYRRVVAERKSDIERRLG